MTSLQHLATHPWLVLSGGALLLGVVSLAYWARAEARARDRPLLGTLLVLCTGYGAIRFAWVRYVRNDWTARQRLPSLGERLATAYSLAVILSLPLLAILSPPDPFSQLLLLPPTVAGSFVCLLLVITQREVGPAGRPSV